MMKHVNKIPAVCVSTAHADLLDEWLKKDPKLNLFIRTECKVLSQQNHIMS